ncbi:hypothetical protein GCM10023187_56510 [Nibrella viscosa]|uniref:Uncharacterized protein n=1 Tax=Nibrella viscosa TaxID=1084524 RepID=A0ABP8L3K6_9BACT
MTGPFLRREHRNSLRDYLDHFYKAVVLQIEKIQAIDDTLPAKMEQYRRYRAELRQSRE